MNNMISTWDTEKVQESELNHQPSWYIMNHGVYHQTKNPDITLGEMHFERALDMQWCVEAD